MCRRCRAGNMPSGKNNGIAMAKKKQASESFETRLSRLQEIVVRMEAGDLPLEEGIVLYREGVALAQHCRRQLEQAHNEVRLLEGSVFQEFDQGMEKGDDDGRDDG